MYFKKLDKITQQFLSLNFEDYCKQINESTYWTYDDKLELLTYNAFYYKKYPNKNYSFSVHTPEFEKQLLYEGLILSAENAFAASKIRKHLYKLYKEHAVTNNIQLSVSRSETGEITVNWPYVDNFNDVCDSLHPLLNNLGYFIAKQYTDAHHFFNTTLGFIIIEPKFNIDMTDDVYKTGILYHISPIRYKEKILKYGLYPKNKNKKVYHPERIYCLKPERLNLILNPLADELLKFDNYPSYLKNCNIDNKMCLFKIDLNKHPHQLEFLLDPAFSDEGVYTLESISPDCIQYVKEIF